MTRSLILAAVAALALAGPAAAETFQFMAPDGTVHFTNAPTDPRYRRMVNGTPVSGTAEGWLRVSAATVTSNALTDIIRAAAVRHNVPQELVSAGQLYLQGSRPRGRRFVAVSNSGASCVMAADAAEELGLELPQFDAVTQARLKQVLPAFATPSNPLDVTGALLNDIGLLLLTGERPPERRIPILQKVVTTGGGYFWRYPLP